MFGFFVAAASLLGLVALTARRRRHGGFRRHTLYHLFSRLEASPGQEKIIREALENLRLASRQTWANARDARPELAELIRAERLDGRALGSWFEARHDALHELRTRLEQAILEIHDVLDERQKKELAHLLERAPRWGWRGSHYARAC